MAAHQAPSSLGFSRQEYWSGLPLPSPVHEKRKVKVKSLSRVRLLATSWTAAYQAPPSMGFSRQEYWSGVPLPSPPVQSLYNLMESKSHQAAPAQEHSMAPHCPSTKFWLLLLVLFPTLFSPIYHMSYAPAPADSSPSPNMSHDFDAHCAFALVLATVSAPPEPPCPSFPASCPGG